LNQFWVVLRYVSTLFYLYVTFRRDEIGQYASPTETTVHW